MVRLPFVPALVLLAAVLASDVRAAVAIPSGPFKGLRSYLAGVVYDTRGAIRIISEPLGLSIE